MFYKYLQMVKITSGLSTVDFSSPGEFRVPWFLVTISILSDSIFLIRDFIYKPYHDSES
jgi:hypothetical protein